MSSLEKNSAEEPGGSSWEEAWRREIDQRLRDTEEGDDEPWTTVRDELRASLRRGECR